MCDAGTFDEALRRRKEADMAKAELSKKIEASRKRREVRALRFTSLAVIVLSIYAYLSLLLYLMPSMEMSSFKIQGSSPRPY